MAECRDEKAVGVFRIDVDIRDHLAVAEPEVCPRLPSVGGLVHTVTGSEIGTNDSCAAPYVDDVRVGWRDCDGTDRSRGLVVEEREPVGAEVGRAPDPAI